MKNKFTLSIMAVAAVVAFAFTSPSSKSTYTVDAKKSSATWLGKKVTGQHTGGISISQGTVMTDGKNVTGGKVEFDMTSITCTDLTDKEWNDKLIGHLKSDDFFGVDKFKTATIEITKVTLKEGNNYDVTGKLTIKGITEEVTFPAIIKVEGKALVTVAKVTVNRTKYGIKYGSASFIDGIGDKAISDEFELNVNVVATTK